MEASPETLAELYRQPTFPGSLGGVDKFWRGLRSKGYTIRKDSLQQWMQDEDLYQLHKPSRKNFPRRPTIVQGIDHLWQADLSDVSSIQRYNNGYRFLLFIIDAFDKYSWVRPLKDKTGKSITEAVKDVLKTSNRAPLHFMTDKGGEFLNRPFKQLMSEHNINFYTSQNEETKAAFVERLQRTFKNKMFRHFTDKQTLRYVDVLQDIMKSYNSSYHRSIGMPPDKVNKTNEKEVRKRLSKLWDMAISQKKTTTRELNVGDQVRISIARRPFRKGYLPQWTEEIFTVEQKLKTRPITYKVKDYDGELLVGSFYIEELQKVPMQKDRAYRIERVIRKRRRQGKMQYFVKWEGYPSSFNSWVSQEDMV